jgi:hypothetical protein
MRNSGEIRAVAMLLLCRMNVGYLLARRRLWSSPPSLDTRASYLQQAAIVCVDEQAGRVSRKNTLPAQSSRCASKLLLLVKTCTRLIRDV